MMRQVGALENDATDLNAEEVVEHRARLVNRELVDPPGEGRVYCWDEGSEHGQALHYCAFATATLLSAKYDLP